VQRNPEKRKDVDFYRRIHGTKNGCELAQLSVGGQRSVPKKILGLGVVIRNWRLIRVAVLGILIGLGIYGVSSPSLLASAGLVIFAYSAWLLFLEGRGIIIDEQTLSFPIRPLAWLPIFALTRARLRLPVVQVSDLTYVGSWMGMERVLLNHQSDRQTLIFQDRDARRRFFEIMKRRLPMIDIYRVQRPNPG